MFKKILAYLLLVTFSFSFSEWIFANYLNKNNTSNYTTNNSKVIIYENWVNINWKYYTKNEFENLLKKAVKISDDKPKYQTRAFPLALPFVASWSYSIPWIWTILVKTWKVFIAWVAIASNSWIWQKIRGYFSEKAKKENYEAKKDWTPTDNHTVRDRKPDHPKADPYSSQDWIDWWKLKQRRYFDENWNLDEDIDYFHWNWDWSHTFPHRHKWLNDKVRIDI